jgi:hypothetical protein
MDEAEVVGQLANARQEVARHLAARATRAELVARASEVTVLTLEGDELIGARHRLAVAADEFGFVVERVEMAQRAGAEDHQDVLGPWCEVGSARGVRTEGIDWRADGVGGS